MPSAAASACLACSLACRARDLSCQATARSEPTLASPAATVAIETHMDRFTGTPGPRTSRRHRRPGPSWRTRSPVLNPGTGAPSAMMGHVVPDDVLDELYTAPPERFVAARDEAVTAARRAGDRRTAEAIGKLRKPTVAAWLVNLLARRRPELVDELLALGDALRTAQHELRGEQMRELSGQRRAAIGGLLGQARQLARESGRAGREALPLDEVEATLTAALAEPEVAEAVRSGLLTRATG